MKKFIIESIILILAMMLPITVLLPIFQSFSAFIVYLFQMLSTVALYFITNKIYKLIKS